MAITATERREVFKDVGQYFQYEKGYVHMDVAGIKDRFNVDVPALALAGDAFPIYNQLTEHVLGEAYPMKNPKGYMPLQKSAYQVLETAYINAYRHNLDKYEEGKTLTKDQRVATYFMLKKGVDNIPRDVLRNIKDCVAKHKETLGDVTKTGLKDVNGEGLKVLAENVANATMAIVDLESEKRRVAYRYGADGRRERLKQLFDTRDQALSTFLEKAMEPYQVKERDVFKKEMTSDISAVMSDLRAMMGITDNDVTAFSKQLNKAATKQETVQPKKELIPGVTCLYDNNQLVGFTYQDATIAFKNNAKVKALQMDDGAMMLYTDKATGVRLKDVKGPLTISLDEGKVDLAQVTVDGNAVIKSAPEGTVLTGSQLSGYTVITGGQIDGSTLVDSTLTKATVSDSSVTASQVTQSVVDRSEVVSSELSAAYLVTTTAREAKISRSALADETVTGDMIDVLSVNGTRLESKADFTKALKETAVDIEGLSVIDDTTVRYQLPDQDAFLIQLPQTKDLAVTKTADGFTLETPERARVSIGGNVTINGGDLRLVSEANSSVELKDVKANNGHQDNVIKATSGQETIVFDTTIEDACSIVDANVQHSQLKHAGLDQATVLDSYIMDSSVMSSTVTNFTTVDSSELHSSDIEASRLMKVRLDDVKDVQGRYQFGLVTYEAESDYKAVVADYKVHPDEYFGNYTGPFVETETGYTLDQLNLHSDDLNGVRVSREGNVKATFANGSVLAVDNVTATDTVTINLTDNTFVNLSHVIFEGDRNRIDGSATIENSTVKEGSILMNHTEIVDSVVDSSSLKTVTIKDSQLLGVDHEMGTIEQSNVVNSHLIDSAVNQVKDLSESRLRNTSIKGSGQETVAFSDFVDANVALKTSIHHTDVAHATIDLAQETSHVLGDGDDRVTVYRDVESYQEAVSHVNEGATYDEVTSHLGGAMPALEKDDQTSAADFDQYVGDDPIVYDGPRFIDTPEFEKEVARVMGPEVVKSEVVESDVIKPEAVEPKVVEPKVVEPESEVTTEASKPFELDMSADLSAFNLVAMMNNVEALQQEAMADIDPDQFVIEGTSSSQGL